MKRINRIALFLIVCFGAWIRFWGYPGRYGFDIDATRDAILTQYAALNHLFPLTGPISSFGSFTFGPWYYYQLIIFRTLVPLMYAPWIYISLISLLTVIVMYLMGKSLINRNFGLLLAFLTAIIPGEVIAGTGLSNPDLVSFYAAIAIWLFILLLKSESKIWLALLMGISIGIGINDHYQMIYFLLLPIFLIFRKKKRLEVIILNYLGIGLTFLPLFYFNLTHHWQTISGLVGYYFYGENKTYVPNRWLTYLFIFWPTFWGYVFGLPIFGGALLMMMTLIFYVFMLIKRMLSLTVLLIFIFFICCFVLLRFFSGERVVYYLIFLHPLLIIITGTAIWYLNKIKFGYLLIGLVLLTVAYFSVQIDIMHMGGVESRSQFVNQEVLLEKQYPGKDIAIYACSGQYRNQVQALVFLLDNRQRLGNDIKIGFKDPHCSYPPLAATNLELGIMNQIDLTKYSNEELIKYHWTNVTPKSIAEDLSFGKLRTR